MICGVTCPFCDSRRSTVVDSRASSRAVRRRRKCVNCKERFTTYEFVFDELPDSLFERKEFKFAPRKGMIPI